MVQELIIKRKSIREFKNRAISEGELLSLFEAASLAPSSYNEQPWRFIIAERDNEAEFFKMLSLLMDKNQEWAKNASLLVLVVAKSNLTRYDKPNKYKLYDVASAVANLTFQAASMDLSVHQMGGFNSEIAKEGYEIPDGFEPVVVLAIGESAQSIANEDNELLEDRLKTRKNLSQSVFTKKFGNSLIEEVKPLVNKT